MTGLRGGPVLALLVGGIMVYDNLDGVGHHKRGLTALGMDSEWEHFPTDVTSTEGFATVLAMVLVII